MKVEIELEELSHLNDRLEDIKKEVDTLISYLWRNHIFDRYASKKYNDIGYAIERLEKRLDKMGDGE